MSGRTEIADAVVLSVARVLEFGAPTLADQRRAARLMRAMLAQLRAAEEKVAPPAPCPVRIIQRLTAQEYGLTHAELLGDRRAARFAHARAAAIYLARELTQLSWPAIARKFDRDHTTCMHAHRVVTMRRETDPATRVRLIRVIAAYLQGGAAHNACIDTAAPPHFEDAHAPAHDA